MQDFSDLILQDMGADYTIELGTLLGMGYETDEKLHLSAPYYPIFNEQHRPELNRKIVTHYLMREISVETPQAFVLLLGRKMNEIMPYYNKLYESELLKYDPFITTEIWQTSDTNNTSESSGKSDSSQDSNTQSTSENKAVSKNSAMTFNSEFPQTRIDDFRKYATNASQTDSEGTTDSTTTQNGSSHSDTIATTQFQHQNDTGNSTAHTSGFSGSRNALLNELRSTFLNIDMMVINELEELFMQTWGTGDSMTHVPIPPYVSTLGTIFGRI